MDGPPQSRNLSFHARRSLVWSGAGDAEFITIYARRRDTTTAHVTPTRS